MGIEEQTATVFYAPTARRRYLTKRAAIEAEARAIIRRKYPSEAPENDESGRFIAPGFHWQSMPRAEVMHRRLCRLLSN